jgi:hypothetical protein
MKSILWGILGEATFPVRTIGSVSVVALISWCFLLSRPLCMISFTMIGLSPGNPYHPHILSCLVCIRFHHYYLDGEK